jgi:hypothetical protein
MWDEIFGVVAFIILFVGGLLIYHLVERWQERKKRNN